MTFLQQDPARLAFLLRDRLQVDDPQHAVRMLENERLSLLVRGMALLSLLADLLTNKKVSFHATVVELLDRQAEGASTLRMERPSA